MMNKLKFFSISMGVILTITFILSNKSLSHTEIKYKELYISKGDTLWNIAQYEKNNNLYFENKDIRDIVYEIQKINNFMNSNLKIGDKLNIPTI